MAQVCLQVPAHTLRQMPSTFDHLATGVHGQYPSLKVTRVQNHRGPARWDPDPDATLQHYSMAPRGFATLLQNSTGWSAKLSIRPWQTYPMRSLYGQ